jgi:hypothetical protein
MMRFSFIIMLSSGHRLCEQPMSYGGRLKCLSLSLLSGLLLFIGCTDLDRSNPLDPKNPDSHRDKIVLVEAFVNQSGGDVITWALNGLEQLTGEYDSRELLYLEHHVAKNASTDPLALDASLSRYLAFVPTASQQGLPDVFFNGCIARVQGASSAARAYQRYLDALKEQMTGISLFTIEATARNSDEDIVFNVAVAPLGRKSAADVVIYNILAEELSPGHPVVRAIVPVETFDEIHSGEIKKMVSSVDVESDWQKSNLRAFVVIQNNRTCEVSASTEVDIEPDL